jgi:hypothetical protein
MDENLTNKTCPRISGTSKSISTEVDTVLPSRKKMITRIGFNLDLRRFFDILDRETHQV